MRFLVSYDLLRKTGTTHIHKGMSMSEFTIQMLGLAVAASAGAVISAYVTTHVLAFRTRSKRHARENALREITQHKWDTGEPSDAIVITRIALRGLDGE